METIAITVRGLVQGIGFRPFVAELAEQLNITGWVRNSDGIVTIQASQEKERLELFLQRLAAEAPEGSRITSVTAEEVTAETEEVTAGEGFTIITSSTEGKKAAVPLIPADLPTCDRCREELHDPKNRRCLHPFISCTGCGPRYSIIDALPYDRDTIVMKDFPMCPDCAEEYSEKRNIRRHAQTICCPDCGPKLTLSVRSRQEQKAGYDTAFYKEDCINRGAQLLISGGILAIKDIGGYHLAASPFHGETVSGLRLIKHREKKPFAVMFSDLMQAEKYCFINEQEKELLRSPARPIVLLRRKTADHPFDDGVCGSSPDVGAMLPCNPVQILLTELCGPLIMTSANTSGDLLTLDNEEMEKWMDRAVLQLLTEEDSLHLLGVLSHDRQIRTPLDDSIQRVVKEKLQTLRRARGLVPEPLPFPSKDRIFAAGGDLKSVFAFVQDGKAYLGQHLGDLEQISSLQQYEKEKNRMTELFGFTPERNVCDLHPAYLSAMNLTEKQLLKVQHHEAHVASVIAEHDLKGAVLGFAFDGTGYGRDGSIWGSETFLWDKNPYGSYEMKRVAHLKPVELTGGDEGAKNCNLTLYGYLASFRDGTKKKLLKLLEKQQTPIAEAEYRLTELVISRHLNTVQSTSMGRLFDAVSAFLDICHYNSYEGEAPVELENLAVHADRAVLLPVSVDTALCWDTESLFLAIGEALENGEDPAVIARGFILAAAEYCMAITKKAAPQSRQIVLSGGTFLNRILLETLTDRMAAAGYELYRNEQVPPGDGGLCLGQAYLAADCNK